MDIWAFPEAGYCEWCREHLCPRFCLDFGDLGQRGLGEALLGRLVYLPIR